MGESASSSSAARHRTITAAKIKSSKLGLIFINVNEGRRYQPCKIVLTILIEMERINVEVREQSPAQAGEELLVGNGSHDKARSKFFHPILRLGNFCGL